MFARFSLSRPVRPSSSACSRRSSRLFDASRYVNFTALPKLGGSLLASLFVYWMSRRLWQDWMKSRGTSRDRFVERFREVMSAALGYKERGIVMRFRRERSTWFAFCIRPSPTSPATAVKSLSRAAKKMNRQM